MGSQQRVAQLCSKVFQYLWQPQDEQVAKVKVVMDLRGEAIFRPGKRSTENYQNWVNIFLIAFNIQLGNNDYLHFPDEQQGKLHPKVMEAYKKKTHFSK